MSGEQTKCPGITLIGRTFTPATNDGRQGWEFRYVDHQPYPVWFGTESTDFPRHLAAALDEIERLRAERDAERLIISDLTAEVERLKKRLQACQSNDDYALTDDCITQNERFLLADSERLRAERDTERQHADRLADALRIVVRDWCPSSVRVPILDEHEARRER